MRTTLSFLTLGAELITKAKCHLHGLSFLTVSVQIFMATIFRGLHFRGDEFSCVSGVHLNYSSQLFVCTNFRGFNFREDAFPRKLVPNENFYVYGISASILFQ